MTIAEFAANTCKYLLVAIDSTNQVAELNKSNNTAAGQIP